MNCQRAAGLTLPELEPPNAREEVIEILAYGICELVIRGCKPDHLPGTATCCQNGRGALARCLSAGSRAGARLSPKEALGWP